MKNAFFYDTEDKLTPALIESAAAACQAPLSLKPAHIYGSGFGRFKDHSQDGEPAYSTLHLSSPEPDPAYFQCKIVTLSKSVPKKAVDAEIEAQRDAYIKENGTSPDDHWSQQAKADAIAKLTAGAIPKASEVIVIFCRDERKIIVGAASESRAEDTISIIRSAITTATETRDEEGNIKTHGVGLNATPSSRRSTRNLCHIANESARNKTAKVGGAFLMIGTAKLIGIEKQRVSCKDADAETVSALVIDKSLTIERIRLMHPKTEISFDSTDKCEMMRIEWPAFAETEPPEKDDQGQTSIDETTEQAASLLVRATHLLSVHWDISKATE